MSLTSVEIILTGTCPICEASVVPVEAVEEAEIITCMDCQSMLVVEAVNSTSLNLQEAPAMDEDWGE